MCRHVCTVANAVQIESTSPRGWGLTMYALAMGLLASDDPDTAERLFQCAGCELCYGDCVSDFRPARAIRAARADLVIDGVVPTCVARVARSVREQHNPYGRTWPEKSACRQELTLTEDGDVLFFAGCDISYRRLEIGRAVVDVARAAGVRLAVLDDEPCCGAPLHTLGYWEDAGMLARANIERVATGGYATVVFACPTCQRAFGQVYQEEMGLSWPTGVEIVHTSQWMERLIDDGKLNFRRGSLGEATTYHDPCTLGRAGLGIYDSPRNVLRQVGMAPSEMEFNREMARCCGSAMLHETYPEIAQAAAANTMMDVRRTGATTLITACPSCKGVFAAAAQDDELRVVDIVELVASSLK